MSAHSALLEATWAGAIPLRITLSPLDCRTYDASFPYLVQIPRLSYLPFLLPRLRQFFSSALINPDSAHDQGWFSVEGVPLRWQYPVGLLFDLLSGSRPNANITRPGLQNAPSPLSDEVSASPLPWHLIVHFSEWPSEQLLPLDASGKIHQDLFMQSVKEADYLRNGTGKTAMLLSKEDSTNLWQSVCDHDLTRFAPIYRKFLNPQSGSGIRHVPIKLYIPQTPAATGGQTGSAGQVEPKGALRVVQGLVPLENSVSTAVQTLGIALHSLLPKLFPSRGLHIHASAVLHGATVPLATKLQDLIEGATFCDGFLHVAVTLMDFGHPLSR